MQQRDFDEFCELLDVVAEQYSKTMTEGLKMLYWQGLVEYDIAAVRLALSRHLKNPDNGMFMPKIADIVKMMQGNSQDSALVAWTKVDKAIRSVGCDNSVVFDDPIIHRVLIDMGGWSKFRTVLEDEMPFKAREFEQRYRGYKSRNEQVEYPPVMVGCFESHNSAQGQKVAPPVLVGNPQHAKQVMLGGTDKPALTFTRIPEQVKNLANSEAA
jgi:hypothetical protein